MKKLIALLLTIVIAGCASMIQTQQDLNNASNEFHKATGNKAFARAFYKNNGWKGSFSFGSCGGDGIYRTIQQAESCAMNMCIRNSRSDLQCVITHVNSISVLGEELKMAISGYQRQKDAEYAYDQDQMAKKVEAQRFKEQQIAQVKQNEYNAYMNQKKAVCKSYGYSESNGMAECVEREINAEKARLTAQAAEQNRINQQNFRRQQQALGDLADTFSEISKGTYGQPKTSICNFKSSRGAIISGDCKKLTITIGNATYWRMD